MGWSFLASVGEQIMETTSSLHVILFRTENNLAGKTVYGNDALVNLYDDLNVQRCSLTNLPKIHLLKVLLK